MFKKILMATGALLLTTTMSFATPSEDKLTATAKCDSPDVIAKSLTEKGGFPLATFGHNHFGVMTLVIIPGATKSDPNQWIILYFKNKNTVCALIGGENFEVIQGKDKD